MTNSKLTDAQQILVVQSLACFDPPTVVVEAIRKEFDVKVSPQSVEYYDPTKRAGAKLPTRWRTMFTETRKQFLEDTGSIGISHKAVRLRALDRMAAKAEQVGNIALAASMLEQAAKESGGALTNRRELTGANGTPLQAGPTVIFELPNNGR